LDQDEFIDILDHAMSPESYEVKANSKIDNFEIYYEESVSYFNLLENFEKIRCNNDPGLAG
jgi:hypothetical protein